MTTERNELLSLYSDLYKDARGFRPRGIDQNVSVEELRLMVEDITAEAQRAAEEYRAAAATAVLKFESLITTLIAAGAGSRVTAIRWLIEAGESRDMSDLEWEFDLPMGYLPR